MENNLQPLEPCGIGMFDEDGNEIGTFDEDGIIDEEDEDEEDEE